MTDKPTPAQDLRSAVERLESWLAFAGDRPGQYVGTTSVANDDIRAVLAALAQPAENAKGGEVVDPPMKPADVRGNIRYIAQYFERLLNMPADQQPHYKSGVRPFSNGDLRNLADACRSVLGGWDGPRQAHPPATQPTGDEPVGMREAAIEAANILDTSYRQASKGPPGFRTRILADANRDALATLGKALATPARTDDAGHAGVVSRGATASPVVFNEGVLDDTQTPMPIPEAGAVHAAAHKALGEWLAWPDAARDGPVPVDDSKVISWLSGLPQKLASLSTAPQPQQAVEAVAWMYERAMGGDLAPLRIVQAERWSDYDRETYTETPLYPNPPAPQVEGQG